VSDSPFKVNSLGFLDWEFRDYPARIVRWVDADTVDVYVDQGLENFRVIRVRLLGSFVGVNAYEKNDPDPAKRQLAQQGIARVNQILPASAICWIRTTQADPNRGDPRDGFGRYLAQVNTPHGQNIGDLLINEGLAVVYERKRNA